MARTCLVRTDGRPERLHRMQLLHDRISLRHPEHAQRESEDRDDRVQRRPQVRLGSICFSDQWTCLYFILLPRYCWKGEKEGRERECISDGGHNLPRRTLMRRITPMIPEDIIDSLLTSSSMLKNEGVNSILQMKRELAYRCDTVT